MRRPSVAPFFVFAVFSMACGPTATEVPGPEDEPESGTDTASITGVVYAPGNGPGMVPPGHEIPIAGARIRLTTQRPEPIPAGAYCDQCQGIGGVISDDKGRFSLESVLPETYWLVIEKGQFRLERQIAVTPGAAIELAPGDTTLPSVHDPDNGQWIPRVAIAPGASDALEDILGKMGMGEIDAEGAYVAASAMGHIDVYANGGDIDEAAGDQTLTDLVTDVDRMLDYHIIFIPCGGAAHVDALQDEQVLRNIRDYVAAGGKLYVTDWSGEWADNVFPEPIELWNGNFGTDTDTPPEAYDRDTDSWDPALFGDANGSPSYTSEHAEAIDPGLGAWLDGQQGPTVSGDDGFYNAGDLEIRGNWNHIDAVHPIEVGTDDGGAPIVDEPRVWVIGDDARDGGKKPLTVTYEPAGCGRVLFSTYHTTHDTHVGLVPQERILLYLIMEIGECTDGPVVD